jgi:hypothetical protein
MREISSPLDGFASPFGRRADLLNATAIARLLFSSNEPGVFYDFDDWSTLFQDTAGTQPVTAANQGVALALDKRLGLKLGPELIPSPLTSAGWVFASGWSVSSGKLIANNVIGGDRAFSPVVTDKPTQISFEIKNYIAGGVRVLAGATVVSPTFVGNTSAKFIVTALGNIVFQASASGTTLEIDNISVRELAGNHATQATTAARPRTVIHPDGGVRNLLDRSEEFDDAAWTKVGSNAVANSTTAPDGASTGDTARLNVGATLNVPALGLFTSSAIYLSQPTASAITATSHTYSVYVKGGAGLSHVQLRVGTSASLNPAVAATIIRLSDGVVVDGTGIVSDAGNGWWRVSLPFTATAAVHHCGVWFWNSSSIASAAGTEGIFLWGAQLELGPTATPYQKRVNFLDVTEAGKRSIRRLYFNGTSHFMTTPTITPNTDKAQVFAGQRKLNTNSVGVVVEHSPSVPNNNGAFILAARENVSNYFFASKGTTSSNIPSPASFPAPISNVLTCIGNISGDLATLRVDGTQVAQSTADQGTGNYLAHPMFIGARNGTSLFFNGYLDQLIARFGTNLDSGAIGTTEKYISTKSPEVPTL